MFRLVPVYIPFTCFGLLCAGAALWPALGLTANENANIPRFAPDVATAWQVNHVDGDDYLPTGSGPAPCRPKQAMPIFPTGEASPPTASPISPIRS